MRLSGEEVVVKRAGRGVIQCSQKTLQIFTAEDAEIAEKENPTRRQGKPIRFRNTQIRTARAGLVCGRFGGKGGDAECGE